MTKTIGTDLELSQDINSIEVFKDDSVNALLRQVRDHVAGHDPDVTTDKGRKAIASLSRKVSNYKVKVDEAGKSLVAEWKSKSKLVDAGRKKLRDELDKTRDDVRKPLTEWENAEKQRLAAIKLEGEITVAQILAIEENSLFDRQRELDRKEADLAKQEEGRKAKEAAGLAEKQRLGREEQIRKDAAAQANKEAEEKAQAENDAAAKRERDAIIAKERAEQDKKDLAERVEKERVEAEQRTKREQEEAEEKAIRDQEAAVEHAEQAAQKKADDDERERNRQIEQKRLEDERRSADIEHRKVVNNAALTAMRENGISEAVAKKVLTLAAKHQIPYLTINY